MKPAISIDNITDYHKGETIYVLGCGPSLTPEVCKEIEAAGVNTIGVNYIFKMITPKYHIHVDQIPSNPREQFSTKERINLIKMHNKGTTLFAPLNNEFRKTMVIPDNLAIFTDKSIKFPGIYNSYWNYINLGCSVSAVYQAIELAVIMGASRIILVGVDFYIEVDHSGKGKVHCYDEPQVINGEIASQAERLEKFEHDLTTDAIPVLKEKQVSVINASMKSHLTVFPKAELSEVLTWQ